MTTILVWYMITVGGYNANDVVYSPPMPDLPQCELLRKSVKEISSTTGQTRCVQMRIVVLK